jgi:hypothetical protein
MRGADEAIGEAGVRVDGKINMRFFLQNDPSDIFLGSEGVLKFV